MNKMRIIWCPFLHEHHVLHMKEDRNAISKQLKIANDTRIYTLNQFD